MVLHGAGTVSVLLMLCPQWLKQCVTQGRYPGKAGSISLSLGGDERRKLKWAEDVIHSHHPLPKIEISVNSLGKVVVPKLFLFVRQG